MIEDSIHSGRYPLDQENEKQLAGSVQVSNRSLSDDLRESDIIEIDALDSFKMLSRRIGRIEKSNISFHPST
jgi:hypothetical protein